MDTTRILDGKALAKTVQSRLRSQIEAALPQRNRPPGIGRHPRGR